MKKLLLLLPLVLMLSGCTQENSETEYRCNWIEARWRCFENVIEMCDTIVDKSEWDFERNERQMWLFTNCIQNNSWLFLSK